jgi:hypothetical protein
MQVGLLFYFHKSFCPNIRVNAHVLLQFLSCIVRQRPSPFASASNAA